MTDSNSTLNGSTLCLACGLCCDGSLFDEVGLKLNETENARALKMTVKQASDKPTFYQPCHLFQRGCCSIYDKPEKPHVCGAFRCKLLKRYLSGKVDLETALNVVHTARGLLAKLQEQMPVGNDRPVTLLAIQVMVAYLSAFAEQDRRDRPVFVETVAKYLRFIRKNFVAQGKKQLSKKSNNEKLVILEMVTS
jgi:hypothetical protein